MVRTRLGGCSRKKPEQKGQIERGYTPDIKRNINVGLFAKMITKSATPILKGVTNKYGNHAVTLVEDNDKLYIIDENTASIINGKGEFNIKPFHSIISSPHILSENIIERLITGNPNSAFNEDRVIEYFDNVLEFANSNKSLIEDVYTNIHSDLEFIDNQTDEYGGLF